MNKKYLIIFLFSLLFLSPIIGHASQLSQINIDQYGDLTGYYVINVTNAPTVLTITIPGNITGYEAFSLNNNSVLPASVSGNNISILVENNSLVNISFVSLDATIQKGQVFILDLNLPIETNIILPKNSVIIYTNASINDINSNIINVNPGNIEIEYSLQNITSTSSTTTQTSTTFITSTSSTTITSTQNTSSITPPHTSSTTSSSTTPSKISSTLYGIIVVVIVIIVLVVMLLRRK